MARHLTSASAGRGMRRDALVFMAKWPQPGRAKTRLCPPLSPQQAADMARALLLDTLAEAARAEADRWLAYAPAGARGQFFALVGPEVGLLEADAADLGGALWRAQSAAFAHGYGRVALVASDIPHLEARRYAETFAALDRADVAVGPSGDGGYYLLAARRPTPALFEGIDWSTEAVYRQTRERAAGAGLTVAALGPCDDVDTAADLAWLRGVLRERPAAGRTLALLDRYESFQGGLAAD